MRLKASAYDSRQASRKSRLTTASTRNGPASGIGPGPQKDGQVLFVEWMMDKGFEQRAFIWLADNAHPLADARGTRFGPGSAALAYEYLILSFQTDELGFTHTRPSCQSRWRQDRVGRHLPVVIDIQPQCIR